MKRDIFVVEWGRKASQEKKNGMKFSVNIIEKG